MTEQLFAELAAKLTWALAAADQELEGRERVEYAAAAVNFARDVNAAVVKFCLSRFEHDWLHYGEGDDA